MKNAHRIALSLGARCALVALTGTAVLLASSCTENLPTGPNTFAAHIAILIPHDTLVVGDRNDAQAQATDDAGHVIQALSFAWKTADSTIVGFVPLGSDTSGRARTFIGRRTGRSVVTLTLPDPRFVTTPVTRTEVVVVGGVKISSSHDSTLTAVNDTAVALATGLIHVNGTLVSSPSQGIHWTHLGTHTSTVGTGDTIRYIARSNGVDTLIASHDFCLAGAVCADTAIVRVSQQLTLTLSAHAFQSWSFGDSVGPSVKLADRRGNGLAGTSVRFVPATAFDSAITLVTPAAGVSNPITGQLAVPMLVATGNGPARVKVWGIGPDGLSIVATDSITDVVRQVARRVAIEPLRAVLTANDSIPIRPIARDARGATIADAGVAVATSSIPINGIFAGPTPIIFFQGSVASITPSITGVGVPSNYPGAPQIAVTLDTALFTVLKPDTATAGTTARLVSTTLLDSLARPAFGRVLNFAVWPFGLTPDPVVADGLGTASTTWFPPDSGNFFNITGVIQTATPLLTVTDSAGRIALRRSVTIIPDIPSALKSTVTITPNTNTLVHTTGTTVVTITIRDRFGNPRTARTSDFVLTSTVNGAAAFTNLNCSGSSCTATYTAPTVAGPDAISVKILSVDILGSPIAMTIT